MCVCYQCLVRVITTSCFQYTDFTVSVSIMCRGGMWVCRCVGRCMGELLFKKPSQVLIKGV